MESKEKVLIKDLHYKYFVAGILGYISSRSIMSSEVDILPHNNRLEKYSFLILTSEEQIEQLSFTHNKLTPE